MERPRIFDAKRWNVVRVMVRRKTEEANSGQPEAMTGEMTYLACPTDLYSRLVLCFAKGRVFTLSRVYLYHFVNCLIAYIQ